MQGKTVHFQISHALWLTYFARFVQKRKYYFYIVLLLVAFGGLYSVALPKLNLGEADDFMLLAFIAYSALAVFLLVKFVRMSMPGPQTVQYETKLQAEFGTKTPHYTLFFDENKLIYSVKEAKDQLIVPYDSVTRITEGRGLVCVQAVQDGKPFNIMCPADALPGGAPALVSFLQGKNPNSKVRHL